VCPATLCARCCTLLQAAPFCWAPWVCHGGVAMLWRCAMPCCKVSMSYVTPASRLQCDVTCNCMCITPSCFPSAASGCPMPQADPTYVHANDNPCSVNMWAPSLGEDRLQEHQDPLLDLLCWVVPASAQDTQQRGNTVCRVVQLVRQGHCYISTVQPAHMGQPGRLAAQECASSIVMCSG
jgi:hypothetical protein